MLRIICLLWDVLGQELDRCPWGSLPGPKGPSLLCWGGSSNRPPVIILHACGVAVGGWGQGPPALQLCSPSLHDASEEGLLIIALPYEAL